MARYGTALLSGDSTQCSQKASGEYAGCTALETKATMQVETAAKSVASSSCHANKKGVFLFFLTSKNACCSRHGRVCGISVKVSINGVQFIEFAADSDKVWSETEGPHYRSASRYSGRPIMTAAAPRKERTQSAAE